MMNWGEHEPEQKYRRPIILPLICWIGFVLGLIFVLAALSGCASSPSPRSEVCFLRLLGTTDDGLSVVRSVCMTPEQFAESQK